MFVLLPIAVDKSRLFRFDPVLRHIQDGLSEPELAVRTDSAQQTPIYNATPMFPANTN
jgi:hypothetical protein